MKHLFKAKNQQRRKVHQSQNLSADRKRKQHKGPKSFQTSQGLTGQYSWDEYMLDDENPAIQGMIVFDTELAGFYGVSINVPKSVYSERKDIIDKVIQSIVIKDAQ